MHQFTPRAERTRTQILAAAEAVFAEKGFVAARLQDVAQQVGIRRASIVYYFRDKRELYDAVLDDVFSEMFERYHAVLSTPTSLPQRVEAVIHSWVSYATERPTVPRLVVREAAEALPAQRAIAVRHLRPAIEAVAEAIEEGQRQGVFEPIDPTHFIFAVVGATIFFLAATPTLAPDWPYDPFSHEQVSALRVEVLGIAKRLLGLPSEDGSGQPPRATSNTRSRLANRQPLKRLRREKRKGRKGVGQ